MDWIASAADWVNIGLFGSPVATVQGGGLDASMIDVMASGFVDKINSLFGLLPPKFHLLYYAAAVFAFVIGLGKMMYLRSLAPVAEFFKFYVFLMMVVLLSENWNMVADTWTGWMARTAFQALGYDASYLSPSVVLAQGFKIAHGLYESGISFYRIAFGSSDDSIAGLVMLVCIGGFLWAVMQMVAVLVVTMVFFKLSSLLALCFLPLILLNSTRFMSAPGVVRVIQYGIQFFCVSLIIGLVFKIMSSFVVSERPDANEAFVFAMTVGILCILLKHAAVLYKDHIMGSPTAAGREGASTLAETANSLNRTMRSLTHALKQHNRDADMAARGGGGGGGRRRFRISHDEDGGGASGGGRSGGSGGGGGGSGGNGGGGGRPGRWASEPTDRQKHAAAMLRRQGSSVDLTGLNRAQASEALEKAGLDPTWAKASSGGQSALRAGRTNPASSNTGSTKI